MTCAVFVLCSHMFPMRSAITPLLIFVRVLASSSATTVELTSYSTPHPCRTQLWEALPEPNFEAMITDLQAANEKEENNGRVSDPSLNASARCDDGWSSGTLPAAPCHARRGAHAHAHAHTFIER